MTYANKIASSLKITPGQVYAAIELLDGGNTIPFIARYRKEATGSLDETQIRQIAEQLKTRRALDDRRQTVLKTISEQGKLTPVLRSHIEAAETRTELEDLYQPYKPKRKTRASAARAKGLQALADIIASQDTSGKTPTQLAERFLSEEVPSVAEAYAGARDILAEMISDNATVRQETRKKASQWGQSRTLKSKNADDPRGVYETYYEFETRVDRLRPHQILAINRAEKEKVLRVGIEIPERDWRNTIEAHFPANHRSPLAEQIHQAVDDAAIRLLLPAIERDVRRALTEQAEAHAIKIFATNLRNLLTQPPITGHVVMGIDPGFRTGCKVAIVDPTGKPLATATIYPHEPQKQAGHSKKILAEAIQRHTVTLIAIGNGTASRETEQLIANLIQQHNQSVSPQSALQYLIVNEAGASVYSASELARAELPNMDVAMRGAVSIARRVQDPLAELVKIDPKSIGVGMYQHDVDQKALAETLQSVVESVVNQVGVEANTASPALLGYVSGIGPSLAMRIIAHRDKHGPFRSRKDLRNVSGMGAKTFEQSAGFLRITGGENPLDASAIHPESYPVAQAVIQRAALELGAPPEARAATLSEFRQRTPFENLANELGVGIPTLEDIFEQLARPGRDPRADLSRPILRSDILKMDDLSTGMQLRGTVRNVVDFGAFIDIGVKQDGLLHRSQIPRSKQLSVGDILMVKILKIEAERGRIGLGWRSDSGEISNES